MLGSLLAPQTLQQWSDSRATMPGGQSAVGLLMLGAWEAPLEATPLHLVQQTAWVGGV